MNQIRDIARQRLLVAVTAGFILGGLAIVRVVSLQVVQRDSWIQEARSQQERTIRLDPERGSLLDREGRELAISVPAWSAFIDPSALKNDAERDAVAVLLAGELSASSASIRKRLGRDGYFAWLQRKLDAKKRDRLLALEIPGLGFVKESRRVYPRGPLASTLLGTVGTDNQGLEGLEYRLEEQVAGSPGRLLTMRDARGGRFLPEGLSHQPPTRGADIVLGLDAVIQHHAERELREAIARTKAKAGSVIVMFPGNGDIAALSNHPTFNPLNFPTNPSHLRTNRAVASCYEPGSTFKIFTAAAALETGKVGPEDIIDCGNGSIRVGRVRIRDHHSYDELSVENVLALSSNIGAIRLGRVAGAPAFRELLADFGFGRKTGIDCPGESAGILRPLENWTPLSLASVSFGQEVAVSPLQLATAACAVANGGMLPSPRFALETRRADGSVVRSERPAPRRVISESTARSLSRMLESVVDSGTARLAAVPGYRVAGKTGTAQKVGPSGGYLEDAYVASFIGWAPARDPAVVILVVLDEPQGSYYGGQVAAPVFASLARDVLRYLQIPPDAMGHSIGADSGGNGLGGVSAL